MDEPREFLLCIKGRSLLEEIKRSGQESTHRVLRVSVDSTTDDPQRMLAAWVVVAENNPTGRPPYWLPDDKEGGR